jgi:hypothetical protein
LALINFDSELALFRMDGQHPLHTYDFVQTPAYFWSDREGFPTNNARDVTKILIVKLSEKLHEDYRVFEGFYQILPWLTLDTFFNYPINEWDTTLEGMLSSAYDASPSAAVLDLIVHDPEFVQFRDGEYALHAYDFIKAPMNTWIDKQGNPTDTARSATRQLIMALADLHNLDYMKLGDFRYLTWNFVSERIINHFQVNRWGTSFGAMFVDAYKNSSIRAIEDLIQNNEEFAYLRPYTDTLFVYQR